MLCYVQLTCLHPPLFVFELQKRKTNECPYKVL